MSDCTSTANNGTLRCEAEAGHDGRHRAEGAVTDYAWTGDHAVLIFGDARCTETRALPTGQHDLITLRCGKDADHQGPHQAPSGYSWFPFDRDPERTAA